MNDFNENALILEESVGDGKYTVQIDHKGHFRCLRYGEPWRDLTGDGLVCALAHEVEALRNQLKQIQEARKYKIKCDPEVFKKLKDDLGRDEPDETLIAPSFIYLSEGWDKDKGPDNREINLPL